MGKPKTRRAGPRPPLDMARVKGSDTKIETRLRKLLWREGIRYRKNYRLLPGTPDIAITRHKIAVFCDGEFWHGKDWETRRLSIRRNLDFWTAKIERNMSRDRETERLLRGLGWQVLRFWGTDIQKNASTCLDEVKEAIFKAKTAKLSAWEPSPDDDDCHDRPTDGSQKAPGSG
ncbi:MAG: very short patch repair endonuclease [Deltaproteobacteria bacterium]|nr:very short patch repair endonuclease [Deltaproteobacteria bacterium]